MPDNSPSTGSNNQPDNHISFFTPKVLRVILGVLLFVVLATCIAWWQTIKETENSNQQAVNSNQETQNSTAGWQTYTNSNIGFSFNYPTDMILQETDTDYPENSTMRWVEINLVNEDKTLSAWISINPLGRGGDSASNPIVGSIATSQNKIISYETGLSQGMGDVPAGPKRVWTGRFEDQGNGYLFYFYDENGADETKLVEQILSTFKFIDSVSTADWKTYMNTQYGFEFRYPNSWHLVGDSQFGQLSNYPDSNQYDALNIPPDLESIFFEVKNVGLEVKVDDLRPSLDNAISRLEKFDKFFTNSGQEGVLITINSFDHPSGNHSSAVFLNNGQSVTFSLGVSSEDQLQLFSQILSTFKFTN